MPYTPEIDLTELPDDLWPDSVTLEQSDNDGDYQDVEGLSDIDCHVWTTGKGNQNETQTWAVEVGATHLIQLRGYYPAVTFDMRANVGGTFYQIVQNGILHRAYTVTTLAVSGVGPGA